MLPDEPLLDPYVPAGLHVRRFSPSDVLSFERGERSSGSTAATSGSTSISRWRHNAINALAALHAYAALGLPLDVAGGASQIELSRWHGEELPLPGGGMLIVDCWNANPVSMRAALEHQARVADGGGGSPCSAAWPSSARRRRATTGRWRALRELGVDDVIAVGELARGYSRPTACPRATLAPKRRPRSAGAPAGRRRAAEGLPLDRSRGDRGELRVMPRVLVAALVAMIISILAGPKFIAFLRRNEFGQHIREEGPAHHASSRARR